MVAEALHAAGGKTRKFVAFNCSAVHSESLDSELFGHVQGAFTGAIRSRTGLIEEAEGGTAFFDEIGDLSLKLQIKLLDVVETGNIRRLGANPLHKVHARFVFATHQDLEERIEHKLFRQDLFARINRLVVVLPPLRERLADIPLLVKHFLKIYNKKTSTSVDVEFGAVDELFRYDWPSNVRELVSVIERAAADANPEGKITDTIMREAMPIPRERRFGVPTNAQTYSVGFDPLTDRWEIFEARAKSAYFKVLFETTKTNKEAEEQSGLSRGQLHNIRTSMGLKRKDSD
jgi:DNA-binding NtrC family response regulator